MPEHLIHMYNLEHRFRLSLLWGVRYHFGAKFEDVTEEHPLGRFVDCSGYSRWLVYHGSGRELLLPDGSVLQHAKVEQLGFPRRDYSAARKDQTGATFICFFDPTSRLAGHVWLLHNGRTMESHFGKGIDSRPGLTLALMGRRIYCFRLA